MSFILLGILNSQIDAAGGGSYDLLESQILTSSASSVTFTGLGSYSDYKHLQIRMVVQMSSGNAFRLQFNSDSGSNYSRHRLRGTGSSVTSDASTSSTHIQLGLAAQEVFTPSVADILDFSSSSKNTTVRTLAGENLDGFTGLSLNSGAYLSTAAITSATVLTFGENFTTGSRFSLYGVKA